MKTPNQRLRRAILTGTILPVAILTTAYADNALWDGTPVSLANNPAFSEGLEEGFTNFNNDFATPIGAANLGPNFGESLSLRMGQTQATGATAWGDNRTWIYSGEVFTGPNGIISFAANNDDTDFLRIDGSIVLQDTTWNIPNATVVRGLTPNTWVPFEYRVANGTGGAGPSGQNNNGGAGWTGQIGVVMSYDDENGSLNVADYSGGNGLGQPAEVANGTPTLFRYLSGGGEGGDRVTITASTTVTMSGVANNVAETFFRFSGGAQDSMTLTVNSADAQIRTLSANLTGTAWKDNSTLVVTGSANVRLGQTQDGNFAGNFIVKNGGTGDLIFDNGTNDLNGTTLQVLDGRVAIRGNNFNPVSTLAGPIEINGPNAKLQFGPVGINNTPTTFNNDIRVNDSGTLEHPSSRMDTIGGGITMADGKKLNADITGGILRVIGDVTGPEINKTGAGSMYLRGSASLTNLTVAGGRLHLGGSTTLLNQPVITGGGILVFDSETVPLTPLPPISVVPGATIEVFPNGIGNTATTLSGGTLVFNAPHGLKGEFWNSAAPNTDNHNPNWGPLTMTQGVGLPTGVNTPGSLTFNTFQDAYTALGQGLEFISSTNDVQEFNFPTTGGAPFAPYGVTFTDNIQSRWSGKIFAPVEGVYGFTTTSDDGSAVFIDGANVVNNDRYQGMTPRGGTVFLTAGFHDIVFGHYEGGGDAGLIVSITPPNGQTKVLDNSNLFPSLDPVAFTNPITVTADSTINTAYVGAINADVTLQSTRQLTTTGNPLTITALKFPTADGTYKINTSGAQNELTASTIVDNGAKVTIEKTGAGVFVLDNTTTPQLTNTASVIDLKEGRLGILLQTAGTTPTGGATINFSGGGLVLSSKGGDQSYTLPVAGFGGSNPVIEARKIGTGVAGPLTVALNGNLKVGTGQVLGLKTADNYLMTVGGTADLSGGVGTVSVDGGRVNTASVNALTGLNIAFGTATGSNGTLNIRSAAPTIASVSGGTQGVADLVIGDGAANSVLTINQATNTQFGGNFKQEGTTVASIVKLGAGTLTLSGRGHNYSGGLTVNGGTVMTNGSGLGTSSVTLNGGTLAAITSTGLLGEYWDSTVGGDGGAQAGFGTDLATFDAYFAGKDVPTVSNPTTTSNRQNLGFSSGGAIEGQGPDTATFIDQGFTAVNNMAVRLSGNFVAPVSGVYTFKTRSDDGSVLFIDGVKVVNNNNYQGMTTAGGAIQLSAGPHSISVGFYEGTGGSGLEVRYSLPDGGVDQFITNNLLTNGGIKTLNTVVLQASSTINPSEHSASFGSLTTTADKVLTGLSGDISFTTANLTTVAGGAYEFNKSGRGYLSLGGIASNGGTNPVTIRKTGDGNMVLGVPAAAQLNNATDVVAITSGQLVAVSGNSGLNPLGQAVVQIGNGAKLGFSTAEGTATLSNAITVAGSGSIVVGNFGFGGVDAGTVTIGNPLTITPTNKLTVGAKNSYTLNLNAVSGGGDLGVDGGIVNANQPITAGAVEVKGKPTLANVYDTTLTLNNTFTAASVKIESGAVVKQSAGAAYTTTGNTTTVDANAEFQVNGGAVNSDVVLNGGLLRAQTGVTDLGTKTITGAGNTLVQNALRGVLHLTAGGLNPNDAGGILNTLLREPDSTVSLTGEYNIPQGANADAGFGSLFNSPQAAAGQAFTAVVFGKFTAPTTGVYEFQSASVDDDGAFWVDLNNNGIFEGDSGSAGNESLSPRGCCGDANVGSATLVAGQSYNVAFGVQDTGGGSGYVARFKQPNGTQVLVNPSAQPGLWSSTSQPSAVVLDPGAELRAARVNGASVVALTGAASKLVINSPTAVQDTVDSVTALAGIAPGAATLEIGANNTLTAKSLSVADEATLIKTGAGTLTATTQSFGSRLDPITTPALQIEAGVVNLNGAGTAFRDAAPGDANSGNVVVNGGTLNVNGAISGSVVVNPGGKLGGGGTVGATTITGSALVAAVLAPSILTTGPLTLSSDARIEFELGTTTDRVNVNGDLRLDGFLQVIDTGGIVLNNTYRIFEYTGNLDDQGIVLDPAFIAIFPGSTITLAQGQVNLVVVPEPTAFAALFGGIGMLAGLRRFRRS